MPLIQKAFGTGGVASFAVPTQPNNVVLVAACVDDNITDIGTVTDNLAPVTSYSLVTSYAQSNFQQAEVYYLRDTARPGGSQTITVSGGPGVKVWIYELSGAELAMDTGEGNSSQSAGTSATPSSQPNSSVPSFCPNFDRVDQGCGFFLLAVCACTAGVTGVDAAWTLDTIQGGDAAAYRYVSDVSTLGTSPLVVFTAAGVTEFAIGLGAMNQPGTITGNIVIQKTTSPAGSPQSFTFTPSYGTPFTLTDGQSNTSGPLAPGTYSVVETPVTGWATTTSSDPLNIVVTAGNTTTVTFTNTISNIVIQKATVPSGSGQSFTFTPSYGVPFILTDGQSNDSGALVPGTYSVVETPVPGWTTVTSSDPANIVVLAGQTTTVTFTNTAPGTIITAKATVPSGSSQAFNFTSSYGAPFTLTDGQTNNSGPLVAGTYSVAEAPVTGWTTTVSQDPAAIVVTPGSSTTVTFTNTATPGHIVTSKVMVPPSSQRFTFNPSWGNAFTLGNGESNDSGPLAPGTYTISELPVDGWTTTATPNPADLTVTDGQTTTVVFTNMSSISGPPPTCDTPISTLAENVLNRLEEKFNVS